MPAAILPNISLARSPETIIWSGDWSGELSLIDQTLLPGELTYVTCHDVDTLWEAIVALRVRGAPAIGIAAAYGVCVAAKTAGAAADLDAVSAAAAQAADHLATSRPTAVNLFWALDRMRRAIGSGIASGDSAHEFRQRLLAEAIAIHDEDRQMCHAIGRFGAELLTGAKGVLTHCNAGGLATAEYGTALACFFTAQDNGQLLEVYVDETRPLLQGARLTAWELQQRGIPATLICDSMAAQVMREGRVQAVVTGADRITARGDAANKIGTYGLAILAKYHGIPFYVAAPTSTFDMSMIDGNDIPIEQRKSVEITEGFGRRTAPQGIATYNPAFDVTPAELITAIITERGVIHQPTEVAVRAIVETD